MHILAVETHTTHTSKRSHSYEHITHEQKYILKIQNARTHKKPLKYNIFKNSMMLEYLIDIRVQLFNTSTDKPTQNIEN